MIEIKDTVTGVSWRRLLCKCGGCHCSGSDAWICSYVTILCVLNACEL